MVSKLDPRSVVITGIGMTSSMGHDVVSSCAAFRAGISRAKELDYYKVINEEDGEEENVIGHPVPLIADGFQGYARLLRMAWPALEDLQTYNRIHEIEHSKTGLYLCIPDYERIQDRILKTSTDENKVTSMEKENQPQNREKQIGLKLCDKLLHLANCPIPEKNWNIISAGHASVILAIHKVLNDLRIGKFSHYIIGAMDSFLEENTLMWLDDTERLKTGKRPAGMQPGEGSAFLFLETYENACRRNADIFALILGAEIDFEPDHLFSGKPSQGLKLSELVLRLISSYGNSEDEIKWLISDQNGESYRAHEWGDTFVRLSALSPKIKVQSIWYPSVSFGDTGITSGAVAVCLAAKAFIRNYAVSNTALILSSSDKGDRGALLLSKVH